MLYLQNNNRNILFSNVCVRLSIYFNYIKHELKSKIQIVLNVIDVNDKDAKWQYYQKNVMILLLKMNLLYSIKKCYPE